MVERCVCIYSFSFSAEISCFLVHCDCISLTEDSYDSIFKILIWVIPNVGIVSVVLFEKSQLFSCFFIYGKFRSYLGHQQC